MALPKPTAALAAFVAIVAAGCFGAPSVGDKAPVVRVTDLDGHAVRVPPGDGRIFLLHLFDPSSPERVDASFSHLVQVHGNLSAEPIGWLSVATFGGRVSDGERAAQARAARDAHGVAWPVAADGGSGAVEDRYGRGQSAFAYVIDAGGTVRLGAQNFQGPCLEDSLRALLADPDQPLQVSLC